MWYKVVCLYYLIYSSKQLCQSWAVSPLHWEEVKTVSSSILVRGRPRSQRSQSVSRSVVSLCDPMDCSSPGSSVHGILQARILDRVAILFSRGSSWPKDRTQVSCFAGWLPSEPPGKESNSSPFVSEAGTHSYPSVSQRDFSRNCQNLWIPLGCSDIRYGPA